MYTQQSPNKNVTATAAAYIFFFSVYFIEYENEVVLSRLK
jgi:hypothetical protein